MKNELIYKLSNFTLRILAMFAKFILIIYIGKYLSVSELGEYSIFFSTITIATFLLGLDFYTFNTRELLSVDKNKQVSFIRDQFVFHFLIYIIVLPILSGIFIYEIINVKYLIVFYSILVLEHISQELYRLLTTLSEQLIATLLLFVRSGIWIYILVLFWLQEKVEYQTLLVTYYFWLVANLLSVILGMLFLYQRYRGLSLNKINWSWIKQGIYISFPFFIGTIAYKIVEFSNRYIIDFYMTKSDVGIFSFFSNIASAGQTLVYTLVIMMFYPRLMKAYIQDDMALFYNIKQKFYKEIIIYSILVSIAIGIIIYPVIHYLDKPEFFNEIYALIILLIAIFFLNLSFVPHYVLFAQKKDLVIRDITIYVAILNVILTLAGVYYLGILGAALAMLISFFLMWQLKSRKV